LLGQPKSGQIKLGHHSLVPVHEKELLINAVLLDSVSKLHFSNALCSFFEHHSTLIVNEKQN